MTICSRTGAHYRPKVTLIQIMNKNVLYFKRDSFGVIIPFNEMKRTQFYTFNFNSCCAERRQVKKHNSSGVKLRSETTCPTGRASSYAVYHICQILARFLMLYKWRPVHGQFYSKTILSYPKFEEEIPRASRLNCQGSCKLLILHNEKINSFYALVFIFSVPRN